MNVRFSRYLLGNIEEESSKREDINLMHREEQFTNTKNRDYSRLLRKLGQRHLEITSQLRIKHLSR